MLRRIYKVILLSHVGATGWDAYVQKLLESGVCNLVSAVLVLRTLQTRFAEHAQRLSVEERFTQVTKQVSS